MLGPVDIPVCGVSRASRDRREHWVLQDQKAKTAYLEAWVLEVHPGKEVDLCLDRKEMRGIRVCRDLRGPLSMLTLLKTSTSKETKAPGGLKESVELTDSWV